MSTPNAAQFHMEHQSKLDDTNYVSWKFKLKATLMLYKLWDIVNGTTPRLTDVADQPAWDDRANSALYILNISVKDEMQALIQDKNSAAEIWTLFHDRFEANYLSRQIMLESRLNSAKQQSNELATDFLVHLKTIANDLAAVTNIAVPDARLYNLALNGLQSQYEYIRSQGIYRETPWTFQQLSDVLMQE